MKRRFFQTYALIFFGIVLYATFIAQLVSFTDATPLTTKVATILICICSILMMVVGLEIQRESIHDILRSNASLRRKLYEYNKEKSDE